MFIPPELGVRGIKSLEVTVTSWVSHNKTTIYVKIQKLQISNLKLCKVF